MLRPLARAAILCLIAVGLSGCLTPRAKVAPSAAVLQARKGAGTKSAACPAGDLATLSPTIATFPFDDAVVDDVGIRALKTAAAWLNCHPGVPVVIIATADNHGTAEHQKALILQRAQATLATLRAQGAADAVIHTPAIGTPDPVSGPHLLIQADGRGW